MSRLTEDDIALAGEYVLGLLDPAETAAAQARMATDSNFTAEVEAWRERLQSMVGGADTPAPDHLWPGIESTLPAPSGQDNGRVRLWQGLTALSVFAAAFFAFLAWQPAPAPIEEKPPLIAALGSETGNSAITARYDATSGELLLTPVSLDTGKLYPELWIIPADGKPRTLGMMALGKPTQVNVTPELRQFMAQGATLAITPEPETAVRVASRAGRSLPAGKSPQSNIKP